ncbi:MAG TPA: ABC transporter substrate-binding protein, partial [Trebonia sp.]|nr:ABC transporter substrate-binding protein [Trebonia sp.]
MKNKVRVSIAAALAAVPLVLAGCSTGPAGSGSSAGAAGSSKPADGGNLVIDRSNDAVSMNKTTTFDNSSIYVMEQIMEPLFTVSNDGKTVEPWLATGYTLSANKLTYTISLRKGVKFSNGQTMTAADVKFSIDQDTATGAAGWGYINSAIKRVVAVNPATVQIDLKYPWAPLLADLSLFSNAIIPNNYAGESETAFYQHPIGTGPFEWDVWKKGQYIKLVKNPHYWQPGKPYLDSVQFSVVPDANTRQLQLEGGQADIDTFPDWSTFATLKATPNIVATAFPSTEIDYLTFNEKVAPFSDVHVRQAISAAIDRKALVSAVLFGNGKPANSLLMPGLPYYDAAGGETYNLAAAKKDLAESSEPHGFTTTLLIASGNANESTVAQIVQSELKPLGITVNIQQLDPTAQHAALEADKFSISYAQWTMDIPDPDEWTSFAVNPKGGANSAFTYYDNPQVVSLNAQAEQQTDSAKRASLYTELQQLTSQDAFVAYLYYPPYAYATTSSV